MNTTESFSTIFRRLNASALVQTVDNDSDSTDAVYAYDDLTYDSVEHMHKKQHLSRNDILTKIKSFITSLNLNNTDRDKLREIYQKTK